VISEFDAELQALAAETPPPDAVEAALPATCDRIEPCFAQPANPINKLPKIATCIRADIDTPLSTV
jgi:hypothetical protein